MTEQVKDKELEMNFLDVEDEEDSQANKYMTFDIDEEIFGIALEFILEIVELQNITEVPDMPVYVKGVINLRGKIIPVIDLRLRFKIDEKEYDDRTCIIVTEINKSAIGLIVDRVREVVDILPNDITPPPDFKSASGKEKYIQGLGKTGEEVKILLDVHMLIYKEDLNSINKKVPDIKK